MSAQRDTAKIKHTSSYPCPVCKGYDPMPRGQGERCWGFTSGDYVHCTRENFATGADIKFFPGSQTHAHYRTGRCPCGDEHDTAAPRPKVKNPPFIPCRPRQFFDYHDASGRPVYRSERGTRAGEKSFQLSRPDPTAKGGRAYSLKGAELVPYRLPELIAADPSAVVFVTEGEKHVDRLMTQGQVATTNVMGGGKGKWLDSYSPHLAGRDVIVLADNDDTGRDHAEEVAKSVHPHARSVKVVGFPELPPRGDIINWLDAGHTIADLKSLASEAPLWSPAKAEPRAEEPATIPIRPVDTERKPRGFNRTDLGNAERLIARHGENLRYCHPWKKWLAFDGKRWAVDNTAAARRWAKDTARSIYREAAGETDEALRKALASHALVSEQRDRLAAMLNLAEMDCPILPEEMDLDPWALNVQNGTIDLRTGKLRPHRKEDLITQVCRLRFDPAATCPLWDASIALFLPHPELADYFQRLCGYALCGVVEDHVLPICYGDGSNGKSTLLGTLLDVLGPDYAMKTMPDLLMAKGGENHPTERADLFGKRLVVAIETEDGRRLNETMVKEFTGGDRIRARRMREDSWEFPPTHTLIMATNHKPVIRGSDNGIWRRLRLIPFAVQVDGKAADKAMPAKLKSEYPGILAWCVRGCLEWQARGLDEPQAVMDATGDYRKEQDALGRFLEEFTIIARCAKAKARPLYQRYKRWADESNEKNVLSEKAFGQALEKRGLEKKLNNGTWYLGIGLRAEGDDVEEGAI